MQKSQLYSLLCVAASITMLSGCSVLGSLADHRIEEKGGYMQGRAEQESFSNQGLAIDQKLLSALADIVQSEDEPAQEQCETINGVDFCYQ